MSGKQGRVQVHNKTQRVRIKYPLSEQGTDLTFTELQSPVLNIKEIIQHEDESNENRDHEQVLSVRTLNYIIL